MQEFWDAFEFSEERETAVREHITSYQRDDDYYDLVVVAIVSLINKDGDRAFWDRVFGQTRTQDEIDVVKFEILKSGFGEYYHFFTKNRDEFPKETERITQIAINLYELGCGEFDEERLKEITNRTKLGVECVLYQIWAAKLFTGTSDEFDVILQRIYQK